jgi:hypothetical protein
MPLHRDRLEARLTEYVRAYLDAHEQQDNAQQEEALRWVCSTLEWLLGGLLSDHDEWDPYSWFDGVTPLRVSVLPPAGLEICGVADWYPGNHSGYWIDPFAASVRLTAARDALAGYRLRFGSAAHGLGRVAVGSFVRDPNWYDPREWLFEFTYIQPDSGT